MKYQILFSGKNKKNISKCRLLKILPRVLSVNYDRVAIIRNKIYFCRFYGCVNADEPLTNVAYSHLVLALFSFITKTRLFKYIEKFTSKNRIFSGKKF